MKEILNFLTRMKLSNSNLYSERDLEDRALFIGIIAELVLSKELFKKNDDLSEFVEGIFEVEFLEYLFRSRTLLLSRIIRLVETADKRLLHMFISKTFDFIDKESNDRVTEVEEGYPVKRGKKKSNIETIESWRKVISRDNE